MPFKSRLTISTLLLSVMALNALAEKDDSRWKEDYRKIDPETGAVSMYDHPVGKNRVYKKRIVWGVDDREDQKAGFRRYLDLSSIEIRSETEKPFAAFTLSMFALLPENENLDLSYQFGLDTDNALSTGIRFNRQRGIDKIVIFHVKGSFTLDRFEEKVLLPVEIVDTASKTSVKLKEALEVSIDYEFGCPTINGSPPSVTPIGTRYYAEIENSLLNVTAPSAPVVIASMSGSTVVDKFKAYFEERK